jgi:hypothetical protein
MCRWFSEEWEMIAQVCARAEPAAGRAVPREQVRLRLRQLDACLEQLEGAHERGAVTVHVPLALAVGRYVPAVAPGMTITHAHDLVMREQEPHLACSRMAASTPTGSAMRGDARGDSGGGRADDRRGAALSGSASCEGSVKSVEPAGFTTSGDGLVAEIDETAARELTERIRAAACTAHRVCSLLVEAHERRAWSALGYHTWSDYIRAEFRLSRSRSYELLDHGRVLRALEAATGLSGIPDISAYVAAQIKPHLAEVTEAIRARTAGLPPEGVARVADQVVQEARSGHGVVPSDRRTSELDISRLYEAVHTLAHMPAVASTLAVIPSADARRLHGLHDACRWLLEFARAWPPAGPG